jgi:hypothetical protein
MALRIQLQHRVKKEVVPVAMTSRQQNKVQTLSVESGLWLSVPVAAESRQTGIHAGPGSLCLESNIDAGMASGILTVAAGTPWVYEGGKDGTVPGSGVKREN